MDWYVIQYLYPSAMRRFCERMFPNLGVPCVAVLEFYDIKKLYHFFDKQGVFLTVEMYAKDMWIYTISLDGGRVISSTNQSKSKREDIETEGFEECFRLLDNRIKRGYK